MEKIPTHWKIARLCDYVKVINGYPFDSSLFDRDEGIPLIRIRDIFNNETDVKWTGDIVKDAEIYNEDILVGMDGDFHVSWWQGGYAMLNQRVCCIRANEGLDQRFTYYFLPFPIKIINDLTCFTTVKHLSSNDILKIRFGLPGVDEQVIIANFLDQKTGYIDVLIAEKERQIELLQENRIALINHTITKGLDPNVPMKDSVIEYLVKIPEHWNIRKLKYIASTKFSNVDKHTVDGEHPVRLCNYTDVYYNDYITEDLDFMKATANPTEIKKYVLKKGDVIITKDSETWDDIAVPAYVSMDFNDVLCGYHLAQIRPNIKIVDGKYLYRSFSVRGINDQFRIAATGVTRYGLGKHNLDNAFFLVPPMQEQYAIAEFLDREIEYIDSFMMKIQASIDKLIEYRIALISATVRGEIDVRKEVA